MQSAGETGSTPASVSQPNNLELLERITEQALQNTMCGSSFLANGLANMASDEFLKFRKDGKEDPSHRHRCRYCGKVFGSDSALQIHIRSHTGERPFKCNVCGNRFSTKGNLKVHFQRHRAKYPHVKMNPNPIPEHMDKDFPLLEPPSGSQSPTRSESPPIPSSSSSLPVPTGALTFTHSIQAMSNSEISESMAKFSRSKRETEMANRSLGSLMSQVDLLTRTIENSNRPPRRGSVSPSDGRSSQPLPLTLRSFSPNEMSNTSVLSENSNSLGKRRRHDSDKKDQYDSEVSKKEVSNLTLPNLDGTLDKDDDSSQDLSDVESKKRKLAPKISKCLNVKSENNGESNEEMSESGTKERSSQDKIVPRDDSSLSSEEDDDHSSAGCSVGEFPFINPNFQSYFQTFPANVSLAGMMPPNFPFPQASTPTLGSTSPDAGAGMSQDPILYQDLLPKPGSTDNSWESLMEIQKASETTKLQHLVDNIENKLTDPNQCIICHRVLSCKSALQMHYRTHTGERPFKCKICGRAFTTKGNLKTHMGVHRVKPPLRILHQCPVCHKQFTNHLVLSQHIRIHQGEPTEMPLEHIMANEIKPPQLLPPGAIPRHLLNPFGPPPMGAGSMHPGLNPFNHFFSPSFSMARNRNSEKKASINSRSNDDGPRVQDAEEISSSPMPPSDDSNHSETRTSLSPVPLEPKDTATRPNMSTSLAALENHVKTINSSVPPPHPFGPFSAGFHQMQYQRFLSQDRNLLQKLQPPDPGKAQIPEPSPRAEKSEGNPILSPNSVDSKSSTLEIGSAVDDRSTPGSFSRAEENSEVCGEKTGALDLRALEEKKSEMNRQLGIPHSPSGGPQMFPPLFAGLPFPQGRTSTTCQICLKTFACNSALEIHYRSHTKERPFKCGVCDRGFSTKGNMKQHMLTHKIRDLPASLYTTTCTPSSSGAGSKTTPPRGLFHAGTDSNGSSFSLPVPSPESQLECTNGHSSRGERRSSSPSGRRDPSSGSKHVCNVCKKPFSSHSALQIHMRTHTGDKPFKCTICGRAFTTKGNLKVHMGMFLLLSGVKQKSNNPNQSPTGTHMFSNGSSRRGRRMSIDLPSLHLTPPKGSDPFLSNSLYHQMLPLAYLNGKTSSNFRILLIKPDNSGMNGSGSQASFANNNIKKEDFQNHGNDSENEDDRTSGKSGDSQDSMAEEADHREKSGSIEDNNSDHSSRQSWQFDMACNFCDKVFTSSKELEEHLSKSCGPSKSKSEGHKSGSPNGKRANSK